MCGKCALKETKSCQNAVIVTKDGKKTTYYLVHEGVSKKSHGSMGFCRPTKDDPIKVKVTGTVEKKDDKLVHDRREDREGVIARARSIASLPAVIAAARAR